ncbi:MAG: YggS family pyridoxal phosphate-dependent enzyme [Oscillospiraceae bacterium]|nr:YggS family pyridoxal phosphate-dependent enzyme [Oscillospiraceae bacterium]
MREHIKTNINHLRSLAQAAFDKRGTAGELIFLAATKSVPPEDINFAASCGITHIGENRVQELSAKLPYLYPNLKIHFIGKLQTNKVKYIIDKVCLIHSVDNIRLATEINRQAEKKNIVMDILLEVNIAEEESKSGTAPEALWELACEVASMENIRVCGLMTMGPVCHSESEYEKVFSKMYDFFLDFWEKKVHNIERGKIPAPPLLSMGMSDSFVPAINQGANIVRVGSAIFKT